MDVLCDFFVTIHDIHGEENFPYFQGINKLAKIVFGKVCTSVWAVPGNHEGNNSANLSGRGRVRKHCFVRFYT